MAEVILPNDYEPRPYQARAMRFFDGGGRRAITVWHRRAGKDLTALHQTVKQAHREVGAYWHFFPTFTQGRRAIWEGYRKDGKRIMENAFPGFSDPKAAGSIVLKRDDAQMRIELKCGSVWRLMGTDRVESVGAGPKGVVFSEFALCRPSSWDLVRPMLRESGGWAWFITTPRGRNHASKLFQAATPDSGWYRDTQTVRDTGLTYASNRDPALELDADEMMAEERAEGMEEALVRQEYLCDWSAALVGSVWGDLIERAEQEGRLESFEHGSDGVYTSWDLGYSDATAIWFWRLGDGALDFVDHYEAHGQPMSHFFDVLEERAASKGYRYAKHWLPHDARARTLQTGQSIMDQCLQRWGADKVAITQSLGLQDGIQAARWLLQQRTRLHPRCGEGIEALRQYHYGYDEDARTYSRKPEHDWSSHTADAFRYAAVVARYTEQMTRKPAPRAKPGPVRPAPVTLDTLFAESGGPQRRRI